MPSPSKFKDSLAQFGVEESVIQRMNENYEDVDEHSDKKRRAAYFKQAVDVMDEAMEDAKKQEILEWNACCKGGKREKASKAFAKENKDLSLAEKLDKIKDVPYMGVPKLNEDGTITVRAVSYWMDDRFLCSCSNFNKVKRDYPVSKSYCFCCGGHFKYHYEIMLGVKLKVKQVVSSPLDSDGENPCVFLMEIRNAE